MSKDRNKYEVTEIERMAGEMDRLFAEAETRQTLPKKHPSIVKAEVLYNAGYRKQSEVIEKYRKKVYSKMEKYTVFGREYIQRIMREVEKEMKGGE